jgi:hypothetical protein
VNVGGVTPGNPGGPTNPGVPGGPVVNPGIPGVVANMDTNELATYRKRCIQVLRDPINFDRDIIALCKLVQTASR